MPVLTDPAQQSANRTASRSDLSSNWRTKGDAPPRTDNHAAIRASGPPSKPDYLQQRDFWSKGRDMKEEKSVDGETLRGEDDPKTLQAIAEGRRLYVGNMSYIAKTEDVEMLFAEGDYPVEHINMSIDPYSGRNPSYCFVELATKEQADRAMLELNGRELLGRPLKLGRGVARSRNRRPREESDRLTRNTRGSSRPVFDRWIKTDAPTHWKGYSEQGRRLFVGGLPRMPDHHTVNADVRELFKGYSVEAVSKVVIPRTPALGDRSAWNHRYLFVDFSTTEEADRAAKATNGRQAWGVKIRVQPAKLDSQKPGEREAWNQEQLAFPGQTSR
ncbi:MAG: hypothetical protein ALECFALPRED_009829 [Alectoria fallacina]|uniref:RRM domain-containing protein n=1 Tax=Alectoria fallacina TaxID=1903189 RepID=A0A8H3PJT3_9LECA|nr:MAG: hypothetical protein ALECFALPRED_009829 [Alectoria fallacina]